jgi:hypothetical protein
VDSGFSAAATPSGVAAYFSSSSDDDDDEVDKFDGWRRRRARGGTAVGGVTAVRRAIVEVRRNKIALGLGTCTDPSQPLTLNTLTI